MVALLIVDAQKNMLEPPSPVPDAVGVGAAIAELLARARSAGALVVHIRHDGGVGAPDELGSPGWELVHDVRDREPVVDKRECDAFAGTALADVVPPASRVIIVGMQSEHCVRETSLAALARGHEVTLVRGAHATYGGDAPAAAISQRVELELVAAGASVVAPDAVRFA